MSVQLIKTFAVCIVEYYTLNALQINQSLQFIFENSLCGPKKVVLLLFFLGLWEYRFFLFAFSGKKYDNNEINKKRHHLRHFPVKNQLTAFFGVAPLTCNGSVAWKMWDANSFSQEAKNIQALSIKQFIYPKWTQWSEEPFITKCWVIVTVWYLINLASLLFLVLYWKALHKARFSWFLTLNFTIDFLWK